MTKPFSLQAVLDLMQNRADEATRKLARLIAAEQDAKGKLDLLSQYREEYARRFQVSAQQGMSPLQWKNFQDFLDRLDDAIAQQQLVVRNSQDNTQAGQAHWQEQRTRLKAIDTLSVRHRSAEFALELRQEQKLTDEIAARKRQNEDN
ncbi:MAG: flagellar export protein FliJ [Sterolibacterium sp.]|jgi:flagellar FliJ protein